MSRRDLLALSSDDLTALSNRGIVKRAQQEVDSDQLTCELVEDDAGNVTARWSDEVECELGANVTLANARCSCPANTLCRHIIRTVLAYKRQTTRLNKTESDPAGDASHPVETESVSAVVVPVDLASGNAAGAQDSMANEPSTPLPVCDDQMISVAESPPVRESLRRPQEARLAASWNPGTIDDPALERIFPKKTLSLARKLLDEGQVLELVCAVKPTARNHTLGSSLRFLVPGDPRYAHCDCSEPAPCSHVPLAVWAFRLLPSGSSAGVISTRPAPLPMPNALIEEIEASLAELSYFGAANAPSPLMDRIRRLEGRCRDDGLIWPAEILAEFVMQQDAYLRHDARFASIRLAELLAELCIRLDAIRNDTGAAPQLFIRGSKADRPAEMGSARLVGLGCGAETYRSGVRLSSYLQDADTGVIVAVRRNYPNPPGSVDEAAPFWQLAQSPVFKGMNLASLGKGQMLVKGGKRSPNHEFLFGRAAVNVNPQSYQWELLRPPALAESFREIASRLSALPPPPLRPRRLAEDFHVCPVAAVEDARFIQQDQAIAATLRDSEGGSATLHHPYSSRGAPGAEALLSLLARPERAAAICFVAGRMHLRGGELRVEPVSLIIEENGSRNLVQPWVERTAGGASAGGEASGNAPPPTSMLQHANTSLVSADPLEYCWNRLMEDAGELLLTGLERAGTATVGQWRENLQTGEAMGFVQLTRPLVRLIEGIEAKQNTLHWDWRPAFDALTEVVSAALLTQTV